jgi:hypothetical protein
MKTKISYCICLIITLGWGCTNLEEDIYSDVPKDEFFTDANMLTLYSGRAYQTLQGYCTEQSLWTLNLQVADQCAVPTNASNEWKQTRYSELQKHNFVVSNKLIRMGWDFCFNGIAACNDVIYQTEASSITFNGKERILAEMKVLRAFYYFCAMDGWGNIPFSIDPTDKSNPLQKDRQFIFSFVEKEITDNLPALDDLPSQASYGRVTQGVAYTLLAKLYLNADEWISTPKWAEAEQACLSVIGSGKYIVEDRYKASFEVNNEISRENIFVIPYSTVFTTNYDYSFFIYLLTLNANNTSTFNIASSPWDGFVCQPDFFASYDTSDTRRNDTWLFGQQKDLQGVDIQSLVIEPIFDEAKYESGRGASEGAKLWKWSYQTDGMLNDGQSMENDFALFRYADVLLMYAELLVRQGKATAELVNMPDFVKIRTRANLTPFTVGNLTLDRILLERSHELAWEGWRRQDLIRFGKFNDAWWAKPASPAYTKLYPIPLEKLQANENLDQNEGYPK